MSSVKRPRSNNEPPESPNITNGSAKKRCITDFFSPSTRPAQKQTNSNPTPPEIHEEIIDDDTVEYETKEEQSKAEIDKGKIEPQELKQTPSKTPRPPIVTSPITPIANKLPANPVNKENSFMSRMLTPKRGSEFIASPKCPLSGKKNAPPPSPLVRSNNNINLPATDGDQQFLHQSYKFLQPAHRRDIMQRKPDDPDYDERTLYVPPAFLNDQTPALRQWWLIKQRNMDAILFFKMGKFYELFNEDAVIGVQTLDINYMKGDDTRPAHAGFPEISYEKYANMLVAKGYKVMRIEQTETPAMMEDRCQQTGKRGKFDKVVNREVCRVTTKGTQMLGIMEHVFHSPHHQYLMAIKESDIGKVDGVQSNCKQFGVCFVDVTISKLYIGQFIDDHNLSKLNILLSHHKPTEVLYERGNICRDTHQALLRTGALLSPLKPNKEFWPIKKALAHMKAHSIFLNQEDGKFEWPAFLKDLFESDGSNDNLISFEPKTDYCDGLDAFGALVYYLQSQLIANQVLRCASFLFYHTIDTDTQLSSNKDGPRPPMILDHIALRNLEIFENSEGTSVSTLCESIDHCKTHFGQRLLRNWLCSPLCDIEQINNRLDAVEALVSNSNASLMNEITHALSNLPDLERLLSKIKSQCFKSEGDMKAIMFDGQQHSKSKIRCFLGLLKNFKSLRKFISSVSHNLEKCNSGVLKRLLSFSQDGGLFPDYKSTLEYFDRAFNHEKAQESGNIIPASGVVPAYDNYKEEIESITAELEEYLEEQKGKLRCRELKYFGSGKNRYQIEVPEKVCDRVPDTYRIETTRKGFKRYYTSKIDKLFQKLTVAEEGMKKTLDNIMSDIFGQFSAKMDLWSAAIDCMAVLDVLQSIASFVRSLKARNIEVCRPQFLDPNEHEPVIEYTEGRHPALIKMKPNFTPNDLKLDQRLILLTGANMGGKSTIMRQTALLTILAQIGSFVTAKEMRLTAVDRVFSRLGASDRLLEGESTFYTELVETSAMLKYASKHSLLLIDELGRGTSTYDGTAIAYAVTNEITRNIQCRCLFSTHYHSLVRDFDDCANVRLAHMGCKVERSDETSEMDTDPLKESITFLYKITDGPVARSYGFNVARLAGIDDSTITEAYRKSKELELSSKILEKMQILSKDPEYPKLNRADLKQKIISEISPIAN